MAKKKICNSPKEGPLHKCPTGITGLDEITGGGLPRERPTLVCGAAGCGKTLLAMEFLVHGATQFHEPGLFLSFEEKSEELVQNFASLGFALQELEVRKKLLLDYVHIERSELEETGVYDLEILFIRIGYAIDSIGAKRVVLDTIENLFSGFSNETILRSELQRLFRYLKDKGVTAIITGEQGAQTLTRYGLEEYVADCVIFLNHKVVEQIATRRLRIVKYRGFSHGTNEYPFLIDDHGFSIMPISSMGLKHSASKERISAGIPRLDTMLAGRGFFRGGMAHSNQVREFCLTEKGIQLRDVYIGSGGVLTGTARITQEAREKADATERTLSIERKQREIERKKVLIEAQIAALNAELESEKDELKRTIVIEKLHQNSTKDVAETL